MYTDNAIHKIIELLNEHNLNAHKFEVEAGLSNASVQAWKNGKSKPSAAALVKVANYFGVSVDYLLGRTNKKETFMDFYERLKEICEARHTSLYALERATGMGKGSSVKWKESFPKANTLKKIADQLDVSTDYLLGRTDSPQFSPAQQTVTSEMASIPLTPDEDDLVEDYRELGIKKGADAQRAAHEVIKAMLK